MTELGLFRVKTVQLLETCFRFSYRRRCICDEKWAGLRSWKAYRSSKSDRLDSSSLEVYAYAGYVPASFLAHIKIQHGVVSYIVSWHCTKSAVARGVVVGRAGERRSRQYF